MDVNDRCQERIFRKDKKVERNQINRGGFIKEANVADFINLFVIIM